MTRPESQTPPLGPVTIALVQMACGTDKEENVAKALQRIADAAAGGANVVCLQELFASQYPCQREDHRQFSLAEPLEGPTAAALSRTAAEHGLVVVGSLFEQRAPGLYHNTAVVFDADGSRAGVYRKMHVPDDPSYYEKFYFAPGDLGFQRIDTQSGPLGVCVCWDQWYPEAARLTALAGAAVIFYPTAIGWLPDEKAEHGAQQHAAWETMIRSHAIANGVFVAAPNRTGVEGELEFWGGSLVCDPLGTVLARAPHDAEETLLVTCDLGQIDAVRTHWPFLRDRRVDAYDGLLKRYLD